MIRFNVSDIRRIGRSTEGVRLINLGDNDRVTTIERIARKEDDEEVVEPNGDGASG